MSTKKFYLTGTGKEVKPGDLIREQYSKDGITWTVACTVRESIIPLLLSTGIIEEREDKTTIPTIMGAISRIANRNGWTFRQTGKLLDTVYSLMPMAFVNILLREIAVMLDEKYPDHINKSEKIYCISTIDGRIHELCKAHIKNYRNFAAFRSIEDAKIACNIMKGHLKAMFNSGK